jgi:hypothetical protein
MSQYRKQVQSSNLFSPEQGTNFPFKDRIREKRRRRRRERSLNGK